MILHRLALTGSRKRVVAFDGGRHIVASLPESCAWEQAEEVARKKLKIPV